LGDVGRPLHAIGILLKSHFGNRGAALQLRLVGLADADALTHCLAHLQQVTTFQQAEAVVQAVLDGQRLR